MNTKTIFAIITVVGAVGMVTPSIINSIAFAEPNEHAGKHPFKSCSEHPSQNKCGDLSESALRVKPVEGWK